MVLERLLQLLLQEEHHHHHQEDLVLHLLLQQRQLLQRVEQLGHHRLGRLGLELLDLQRPRRLLLLQHELPWSVSWSVVGIRDTLQLIIAEEACAFSRAIQTKLV